MPDNTTPTMTEAPPAEDGWRPDLTVLRARLDELDDRIHDLLMDRAKVVEGVARSGKPAAFRPGREAAILRRLLARHAGNLPPATLVRMWREMLAGTTAMQAAVRIATYGDSGDLAREHFGFLTPVIPHGSARAALDAVRNRDVTAAVLPFPDADTPWWDALGGESRLYVVARLPFWAPRREYVPHGDALVVAAVPPDDSGLDRTLIAAGGRISEIEGMVADGDTRLPRGAIILGGYAVPVAGDSV